MKKNFKKALALVLVCVMMLALFACNKSTTNSNSGGTDNTGNTTGDAGGNSNTGSGSNTGGGNSDSGNNAGGGNTGGEVSDRVLKIRSMQDSVTLYQLGVTGGFISVLYGFYEPLFDTRMDGSRRWVLGSGLDRISDLQYTLTIKEGIKFSNGNPLTAEDVMFSMEQCAGNPQFALNVKVVDFEKTKVSGDYTIDLWYTEFNASQEPGFASLLIMDKESFDEVSLSTKPIGTGPYVVTEYVVNSHMKLTARDDYWGDQPKIKNIEFRVINEDAQVVNAMEIGDIDLATIPLSDADYIEGLGYDVEISGSGYNMVTMFSMLPGNPLESKEARWAVCHAIDRQAIADILFMGRSEITDSPVSRFTVDFEARFLNLNDTYSTGFNIDKAKQLAQQSGLVGKTIRIITNGSTAYNTIAEIVQGGLLDIGVDAQIINCDQATYFPTMMDANNFEIAIFNPSSPSWMAVDVLAMYITFIPLGWSGPDRDAYGAASMGAITTADSKARSELLFESVRMFADLAPWYGLCESVTSRAQSSELKGVAYCMPGSVYYQDMYWG